MIYKIFDSWRGFNLKMALICRHMTVGNAAAAAIARRYGTQFTPGNIVELLCNYKSEEYFF